jgi:hypothetical protein
MNHILSLREQTRVRELSLRLRHIEKQIAPFMAMTKEQLEAPHETFPVPNWRVYVVLMEAAGETVNSLADVLT